MALLGEAFPPVDNQTGECTEQEIIEISNQLADQYNIPRALMLGCAVAESDLVWNARRPKLQSQDQEYWPDVSSGVWQQTVRWSDEYRVWYDSRGHWPDDYPGDDIIREVLSLYMDPWHAGRKAAKSLSDYYQQEGDILNALCRYNKPTINPAISPMRHRYEYGLAEAARILGE